MLEVISTFTLGSPVDLFPVELGSPTRDSFVFETYAGPLEHPAGASGTFDLYRAGRDSSGWRTDDHLSRSATSLTWPLVGGVSSDHTYSFQDEGTSAGYLRKPDGSFELTGRGQLGDEPASQGRYISSGGDHVIFSTGDKIGQSELCNSCPVLKLEPDAPPTGTGAVYDRPAGGGPTRVVSLLPGDEPLATGQDAFFKGVSEDGSAVAFSVNETLYVRVDLDETWEVSASNPLFAGLSEDGTYLTYVVDGDISQFNTITGHHEVISSSGDSDIVNVSADGSHIYFISYEQLDGADGTLGEPNLYVWDGGATSFVATVAPSDLISTSGELSGLPALTNWTDGVFNPVAGREPGPGADSSRSTPDGSVLVFESRAQLTTYDNEGYTEIYLYGASEGIRCVSCNELTGQAEHDSRLQEVHLVGPPVIIHNVTEDGSRVFFETEEALVVDDTNGVNDIYQWQEVEGAGKPALISSGKSPGYPLPEGWESPFAPLPNLLYSVTPDGSDVYFSAKEALVPGAGEYGTQGIYDARVGGGFPPSSAAEPCAEDGCHPAAGVQQRSVLLPMSQTLKGSGNVKARKHRCGHRRGRKKRRPCKDRHRHGKARASRSSGVAAEESRVMDAPSVPEGSAPQSQGPRGSALQTSASPSALASEVEDFDIEEVDGLTTDTAAGSHPDFKTRIVFKHFKNGAFDEASASAKDIRVILPPGLLGNPSAIPACSMGDFTSFGHCSADSQVGITRVKVGNPLHTSGIEPVFNLTPPHPQEEVARLGFIGVLYPVFLDIKVRTAGDYGVTATVHDAPGAGALIEADTTLWGDPASKVHDEERMTPKEAAECPEGFACKAPGGVRPSTIPPTERKGFMTNPSACQEGEIRFEATAYQLPGQLFTASAPLDPITDCTGLPFAPTFSAEPTSHIAGAPTGLKTKLVLPQHLGPEERATATMREARVTLPEGMQVAAGTANWIGVCSDEQVGYHQEVDTACPDNSKLGTATITSPALSTPIEGTIYQRSPSPGHQLGLWLTADALGLHVKLPGELEPDKTTGRLTAVFRDLPQVPVEEIDLNVWGGDRAPLQNPDHCGTYTTDFSFSPHSNDPAATGQSQMQITEGCNQGFSPSLQAGVTEPKAGKFSPFVFDLTRPDGDQALRGFDLKLPEGELAKIKGVPLCSDADASAGACPAASRIGSLTVTTGPGPEPFTLPEPGRPQPQIYLAGPYKGSPFSIVSEVPAQAGPFDLGVLAVRSGLEVEPETGRAVVKADPLPQFFEGVGIAYRHLHAVVDRPQFNINPTDCREMAVTSDVTSTQGTVAHPSARFQVDGCKALKFKPKLSLKLRGGTKRADYPALTAVLKARKGDANIAFASVALPHSEFLAQEHIGTICTRKQFAADNCPKGSVYGKAKAFTPLLDKPLAGPVYLRSSDHPLPDLVAKLGGQLEIHLVGRIDSVHGGIRTTFESVPDAPVSKFVLQMKGGAKGLLTNSTDICRGSHRATVQMKAQNGRAVGLRPVLKSDGCGNEKRGKHGKHG